jgi:LuxR family maltose regulon positive regulatory protein
MSEDSAQSISGLKMHDKDFNNFSLPFTKFQIPRTSSRIVNRRRLFIKLDEVKNNKFTMVFAPAGYGKTTLVSSWIHFEKLERQTVWISLNESDNENLLLFWETVITSVHMLYPRQFEQCMYLIKNYNQYPIESIINILINKFMSLESEIIIVIDDCHIISNNEIYHSFEYFLQMLSDNVHVVLISRHNLIKLSSKMKAIDNTIYIHRDDLKFTFDETEKVVENSVNFTMTKEKVQNLYKFTDGWITAIKQLVSSYNEKVEISLELSNPNLCDEYLINYITEEILNTQPLYIQDFLIRSSIFDVLNSSLCDYVLDLNNSYEILQLLEQKNIFIYALGDSALNYKYFDLFRSFMQNRISNVPKEDINFLYMRASKWYESKGMYDYAIDYSFKAGNIKNSIRLLECYFQNYAFNAEFIRLINYIEKIPSQYLTSAKLVFSYVVAVSSIGKLDEDGYYLSSRGIDLNKKEFESYKGQIAAIKAHNSLINGNVSNLLEKSLHAVSLLEQTTLPKNSTGYLSMAHHSVAISYFFQLKTKEAIIEIEKAIKIARKLNHMFAFVMSIDLKAEILMMNMRLAEAFSLYEDALAMIGKEGEASIQVSSYLSLGLANIYYESDNLQLALNYVNRSIELSEARFELDNNCLIHSYLVLAKIYAAWGNKEGAIEYIEKLDRICSSQHAKFCLLPKLYDLVKLSIRIGRPDLAEQFYNKYTFNVQDEVRYHGQLALAEILIIKKKYDEALSITNELESLNCEEETAIILKISLQRALVYMSCSQKEKGFEHLSKAISLIKNEAWIRTFVDYDIPMFNMISELAKQKEYCKNRALKISEAVIKILLSFEKSMINENSATLPVENSLSSREMEILKLVSQGLTNAEIAKEIFISLITVKKHLSNAFLKLNVSNRVQAVEAYKKLLKRQ